MCVFLRKWTSTVSEGRSLAMNHVRQRAGAASAVCVRSKGGVWTQWRTEMGASSAEDEGEGRERRGEAGTGAGRTVFLFVSMWCVHRFLVDWTFCAFLLRRKKEG